MRPRILTLLLLAATIDVGAAEEFSEYEATVLEWREERLRRLKAPQGFLNLAGLFWLGEGPQAFGSDPDNDIRFPAHAPPHFGYFEVTPEGVVMTVTADTEVLADDFPVDQVVIAEDTSDAPVTVTSGPLIWTVIKREGRYAVRVHDQSNPAVDALPAIPHFDIDRRFRVRGRFVPYETPRIARVNTVIEGLGWNPVSPGIVSFEIDGRPFILEPYEVGDRLFFVFGDATSGRETYGAGRFLYAQKPTEGDEVILDFNFSYNPPCAFNDFATCPVASLRNRLPVAITAGEKFDLELYSGSSAPH